MNYSSKTYVFSGKRKGLIAALLAPVLFSVGVGSALAAPTITLVGEPDPNDRGGKLSTMVLTEAFKRIDTPLKIIGEKMARRTAMGDSGDVDGDVARAASYGADHPNLVRVEEPIFDLNFAVYSGNSKVTFKNIDEMKGSELAVEYRRGILFCQKKLSALGLKNLTDVTDEESGIKKLLTNRIDAYCDLEIPVKQMLKKVLSQPDFKSSPNSVRKLFDLGSVQVHTYLHKKNADLAPKLAAALKKMRAEGLLDAYRKQVDTELGLDK